jgi:hypothetical protein
MMDRCLPLCFDELGSQDPVSPPKPASTTPTTKPAAATSAEDSELEKHRARAARFGIPLVEPKQPKSIDETSERQFPDVCIAQNQPLTEYSFYVVEPGAAEVKGRTLRHRNRFGKQ